MACGRGICGTSASFVLIGALLVGLGGCARRPPAKGIWTNLDGVRAWLDGTARETRFSGVVLIGRDDDVVLEQAYGLADADLGIPMRASHRFRIGSLTKPVTASAVLIAVDRGLLALDQPVCELLPSCPLSWAPVTVRHLLTHSSGITDRFGDLRAVPVEKTVEELQRVLAGLPSDDPLRAPPGMAYAYSNFNYVLLGAALEKSTGMSWETVLRRWIFEPLELRSMAYDDVYAVMPDRVRGYERKDSLGLRNIDYDDHSAYAAGGLLSSAGDLFRWSRAVTGAKLFRADLVEESLTPRLGSYGYGWQVRRFFDRPARNHSGSIDGFSSHLIQYPEDGLTIVVLSNVANDAAILRACDVAARLFEWPDAVGPANPELAPARRCGIERGVSMR